MCDNMVKFKDLDQLSTAVIFAQRGLDISDNKERVAFALRGAINEIRQPHLRSDYLSELELLLRK
jgi:hypothetical protein